jgi:hypothetical protein
MKSHTRRPRIAVAAAALGLTLVAAACGSSSGAKSSPSTTSTTRAAQKEATALRGKRYCEVLLLHPAPAGLTADVYNSFPMNACPRSQWVTLDAKAIATENQMLLAVLNGPRYWLMDRIGKTPNTSGPTKSFGGIEMTQRATVVVGNPVTAQQPYLLHEVDRKAVFTFEAGSTVYELTDPSNNTYVMQSWSQEIDPTLEEAGLATLGSKLKLPTGWTYASRTLTSPLTVDTTGSVAKVTTDDLKNTYSLEAR